MSQIQNIISHLLSQIFQIKMAQINSYSSPQSSLFQSQQKKYTISPVYSTPTHQHSPFEVKGWSKKKSQLTNTTISEDDEHQKRQGQSNTPTMDIQSEDNINLSNQMTGKIPLKYKSHSCIQNQAEPKSNYTQLYHHNNRQSNNQVQIQMSQQQLVVSQFTHEESNNMQDEVDSKVKHTPNTNSSDCEISHYLQEQALSVTPRSICQIKKQTPISIILTQNTENSLKKKKVEYSQPLKGLYYKNRKILLKWMRGECIRFQMTRQTYANTVFLMDYYYKTVEFNPNQYLCLALCKLIVASKMNQKKVIYTQRLAKNCQIDIEKMLLSELAIIKWFKYKIDPYNFARILTQYMRRWDKKIQKMGLMDRLPLLLKQSLESFLIYQEIFFLCENHLIQNRQLLCSTIQLIFQYVICSRSQLSQAKDILRKVFAKENIFACNQNLYVFEYSTKTEEENREVQESSLKRGKVEFEQKKQSLIQKFNNFSKSEGNYSIFINIQF